MGRYGLPSVTIEAGWDQLTSSLQDPSKSEVLVRLDGEFDASGSEKLFEQLKVLQSNGHVDLTLDLSGVGFFSASAVGVIVQLAEQFRANKRLFNVVSPSAEARRVFAACGLSSLLEAKTLEPADLHPTLLGSPRSNSGSRAQGHPGAGHALSSWITVPPENTGNETSPSAQANLKRPALVRSTTCETVAISTSRIGTNLLGCGWS